MKQEFNSKLCATVERIRSAAGVDESDFFDLLGTTPTDYEKIQGGAADFKLRHLESFCDQLTISVDSLFMGKVDYSAIAKKFRGRALALPDRYSDESQKLSRGLTFMSLVRYAALTKGVDYPKRILKRLQLDPMYFNDPQAFVSPQLGDDVLAEMRNEGFTAHQIREMGTMALLVNHSTPVGRALASTKSPAQLYRELHEGIIQNFDHICDYTLTRLTQNGCTMETTTRESASEIFKTRVVGNRELCIYKQGVYLSLLGNIQRDYARLVESECMFQGGSRCVYHLSWN